MAQFMMSVSGQGMQRFSTPTGRFPNIQWVVTQDERMTYDKQFEQLKPVGGFLNGDQARVFFLKSNLSPPILGQIWELADISCDGKMDKLEFSIAMKLIKFKLQGAMLPTVLPPSMKQHSPAYDLSSFSGGFGMKPIGSSNSSNPHGTVLSSSGTQPIPMLGTRPSPLSMNVDTNLGSYGTQSNPVSSSSASSDSEWAVPKQSKLKYTQIFNSNDHNKTGFLSGNQARFLLSGTGLNTQVLAQIWNLSDVDKDGKLALEEFVLAMHLSDTAKAGHILPAILPANLLPTSYRRIGGPTANILASDGPNMLIPDVINAVAKSDTTDFTTFEDKRRDNFNKGNVELERRRLALQESQRQERERLERKETELRERREKERLEQERKRQAEIDRQLQKQLAAEREKEETRKRAIEQREAAQREMERQRQMEWERIRRQELLQQKLREQEMVTSSHAKTKELDVELTALQEKKEQLEIRVSDVQARFKVQKEAVVTMNKSRDLKIAAIAKRQEELKGLNAVLNAVAPEKQLATERLNQLKENSPPESFMENQSTRNSKKESLSSLRNAIENTRKDAATKLVQLENLNSQLNKLREESNKYSLHVEAMNRIQQDKVRDLQEARRAKESSLIRKNSMEKFKKQHPKAATEAFSTQVRVPSMITQIEVNNEVESAQNEKPISNKVESTDIDEIKKDNVKKRIAEMQQKRMEQKRQQDNVYATVTKHKTAPESSAAKQANTLQRFKILYNFVARNPDELTVNEGDIVNVNEDKDGEPGWYSGMLRGKTGWFPVNYATRITSDDSSSLSLNKDMSNTKQTINTAANKMLSSAPPDCVQRSKGSAFSTTCRSQDVSPVPGKGTLISGLTCTAIYPWQAKKENHLAFEEGTKITVTEQQAMWWFGSCNGKSGWFPKSYVKEEDSTMKSSPVVKRKAPIPPQASSAVDKNAASPPSSIGKEYVANFSFSSIEEGDLSFEADDIITVVKMEGDWWTGTCKGRTGIFPANYVTPREIQNTPGVTSKPSMLSVAPREIATVVAPYTASDSDQLSLQLGQLVLIKKKNESGWWEGELQARGKKKQIGWFPASYVNIRTSGQVKTKAPSPNLTAQEPKILKPLSQVMAMYDYTSQNNDEITISRGALINVTDKSDPDWWMGCLKSDTSTFGLFPSNYVREISGSIGELSTQWNQEQQALTTEEIRRQQHIHELIVSEESYIKDLEMANEGFKIPLKEKKLLTEQELNTLFVNWNDLILCSSKLVKAFRVRRKNSGDGAPGAVISLIGDILCEQLPNLQPYVRFCSCQMNASSLLQEKIDNDPEFKKFVKVCESGTNFKGLPVSSYLVKPMQRITKYPLLIEKILKYTPEGHIDHNHLKLALERAEEICSQVNEGVREKENADRLEWIQCHVQLDGLSEKLVFNSKTNCLGQRRFLHCGTLYKHKSNKDLVGFLFNDFLMLTTATRPLNMPVNDFIFSSKSNLQFRLYKMPILLNEVLIRLPTDPSPVPGSSTDNEDVPVFHLSHVHRVYTLRAENINERTAWINKIKSASQLYIEKEKKKLEKAHHVRSQRTAGIGRLMVTIVEGCNLMESASGCHDPYCEVTMGVQSHTTKTMQDTPNPKWNSTTQFFVKNIDEDVLCVSVFKRDMFSPDDFLGRTEIKVTEIKRSIEKSKGPLTKKLLLHEVESGEVVVKIDLQLYDQD